MARVMPTNMVRRSRASISSRSSPVLKEVDQQTNLLPAIRDAAYFHLYGIAREDVEYIMETFPIVKRGDEKEYGEYRTHA